MAKKIVFDAKASEELMKGITVLTNTVKSTLGPKGRNVIIGSKFGSPNITKDGVTVAKEIDLESPLQNIGVQLMREVASKTSDTAGDGTTTATVLAYAIYKEGLKNVAAGANPMDLKRGIDKGVLVIVEALKEMSQEVKGKKEISQVGAVSANNDHAIGDIIADAMDKVGKDGVITVEEAKSMETSLETVEGMQFDRGYISPYFITDSDRMECVMENVRILLCESRISTMKDLLKLLETIAKNGTPLLVISEDTDGEALATMVVNTVRGSLRCCAVKAPGFGDRRKLMLEDIAILTGGTVVSADLGMKLDNIRIEDLGTAKKVIIDKDNTTIVEGAGTQEAIKDRISHIRKQIEDSTSAYDKDKLQDRLGKLTGGVAIINIGAATEIEMKEKKARVEDALNATRAAVDEGIIPGGGVALIRCSNKLDELSEEGDIGLGIKILRKALEEPLKQIVFNSTGEGADVVLNEIQKSDNPNYGFDAQTGNYVDMIAKGIIDPTKVTRNALQNAASVAGLLLTTSAMISDIPEEDKTPPPSSGMGGGMPGMF